MLPAVAPALPPAVAPALIGVCAVLASLLLLREPVLVRAPCVIGVAVLTGALGTALTPRRSPFGGVLWAAAWAVGVALVNVLDVALATPQLRGRPLAIAATTLLAVPIDALVFTAVGVLGALAVAPASRWLVRRRVPMQTPAAIPAAAINGGSRES